MILFRAILFLLLAATGVLPTDTPKKKLPLEGEVFEVSGRTAFLIPAKPAPQAASKLWVWYAPTLPNLPGSEERWMFERFQASGIAIAGIDAGESYGSPDGNKVFDALHAAMTARGYSAKPVLLGRSRGGLMLLSWAAAHPTQVAGFAGIYPVCNLASYPGIDKAAPAFKLKPADLQAKLKDFNPVDRLAGLAKAKVQLFAIHGDVDVVVPLEANSGRMKERYTALGGSMTLVIPPGQGHNMWPGFFRCQELVDFVIARAANQKDPTGTLPGKLYREYLEHLIRATRNDIGWEAPWFVAQTSYHVAGDEASPDIRAAQASLWKDGVALEGPDTDTLKGDMREQEGKGVHFSGPGLRSHAAMWVERIRPWQKKQAPASGR